MILFHREHAERRAQMFNAAELLPNISDNRHVCLLSQIFGCRMSQILKLEKYVNLETSLQTSLTL